MSDEDQQMSDRETDDQMLEQQVQHIDLEQIDVAKQKQSDSNDLCQIPSVSPSPSPIQEDTYQSLKALAPKTTIFSNSNDFEY